MSSLIVSHDLHIMMLELAIEKLFVPRRSAFDEAILKKTTVMFRLLDEEWTALYPQRSDYHQYRGSNYETEQFHGGKSILFSLPEASLENSMENVDLQMHITKDVSRYFEMQPSQNVGFVIVKLDKLFNGIIHELKDRRELAPFLHYHQREPISRSMKGVFSVLDENSEASGSEIDVYIRLNYFGKSIITEILTPTTITNCFYAQEETNERYPYQCRELKAEDIEADCWGSVTTIPPQKPQNLQCDCQTQRKLDPVQRKTHMSSIENNLNRTNDEIDKIQQKIEEENSKNQNENETIASSTKTHKKHGRQEWKTKQKDLKLTGENKDEQEKIQKKSPKIDKAEEKSKAKKSENGDKKLKVEKETSEKGEKGNKRGKSKAEERTEKKEERRKETEKIDKGGKTDKTEKSEKRDKTGNMERRDKIDQKSQNKKKDNKEKGKADQTRRNRSQETVKVPENKMDKFVRKKSSGGDKQKAKWVKLNDRKIESDRIKMSRRRSAGPITVGIWEKNTTQCLEITPQCSCMNYNNFELLCPLESAFVNCPNEQMCRNNSILPCY